MKSWAHKGIGVVAVLVGCAWIWGTFIKPVSRTTLEPFDIIFSLTMLPILSAPGAFAVFYGVKVFKTPNKTNIARSIGVLLLFVVGFLASGTSQFVEEAAYKDDAYTMILMVYSLAVLPVYVRIASAVMRWEGHSIDRRRDLFSKPFAVLLAIGVWTASKELFKIIITVEPDPSEDLVLSSIVVFGPVLIAVGFYKLFIRLVGIDYVRPQPTELMHT